MNGKLINVIGKDDFGLPEEKIITDAQFPMKEKPRQWRWLLRWTMLLNIKM
jgi:hypothetical protein